MLILWLNLLRYSVNSGLFRGLAKDKNNIVSYSIKIII